MSREANFVAGESGDDAGGPPIETIGARYGIGETLYPSAASEGDHVPLRVNNPIQSVAWRNGSMETVAPSITQTPLGGLMPGPDAIAPAVMAGHVGAFPCSDEGGFKSGVLDGFPEGPPVPIR
jgi:hypothetical protein